MIKVMLHGDRDITGDWDTATLQVHREGEHALTLLNLKGTDGTATFPLSNVQGWMEIPNQPEQQADAKAQLKSVKEQMKEASDNS